MKVRTPTMTLTSRTLAMSMVLTTTITLIGCSREGAAAPSLEELQSSASASATTTPAASATPSASPDSPASSVNTGKPRNAEEAIDAATRATEIYWATEDVIFNDGGKNPERIDPISTGTARALTYQYAEAIAKSSDTHFERSVEVIDAYATDRSTFDEEGAESIVKHGFVGLKVCNDSSKMTYADPGDEPSQKRIQGDIEVVYDSTSQSWKVARVLDPPVGERAQQC
jgi:hypothetical protein